MTTRIYDRFTVRGLANLAPVANDFLFRMFLIRSKISRIQMVVIILCMSAGSARMLWVGTPLVVVT